MAGSPSKSNVCEPPHRKSQSVSPPEFVAPPQLEFFNGIGGFDKDGREYVTILDGDQVTPAPWVNVIANPSFGFQVSAEGSGYTWSVNSRENQLTPRSNDPVADSPGEAIYLSDMDSGDVWTATAIPIRTDASRYIARHGQGYSRFEHVSHGIVLDLVQFVPLADPIKISRLKVKNISGRRRRARRALPARPMSLPRSIRKPVYCLREIRGAWSSAPAWPLLI